MHRPARVAKSPCRAWKSASCPKPAVDKLAKKATTREAVEDVAYAGGGHVQAIRKSVLDLSAGDAQRLARHAIYLANHDQDKRRRSIAPEWQLRSTQKISTCARSWPRSSAGANNTKKRSSIIRSCRTRAESRAHVGRFRRSAHRSRAEVRRSRARFWAGARPRSQDGDARRVAARIVDRSRR